MDAPTPPRRRTLPIGDVSLIDLHDARLDQLELLSGGVALVRLRHLPVQHKGDGTRAELWSYQATLRLEGVESVAADGPLPDDGWIMGGTLDGADTGDLTPFYAAPGDVRELVLAFASGTRVRLEATRLSISLETAHERFADWVKP